MNVEPRCEAITLASSYSPVHRCSKRHGLQKVGRRLLCAHHRTARAGPSGRKTGR